MAQAIQQLDHPRISNCLVRYQAEHAVLQILCPPSVFFSPDGRRKIQESTQNFQCSGIQHTSAAMHRAHVPHPGALACQVQLQGVLECEISITNFNYWMNYTQWTLVAQHPNLNNITKVYKFVYKPLMLYNSLNETGMFYGVEDYNDLLLEAGPDGTFNQKCFLERIRIDSHSTEFNLYFINFIIRIMGMFMLMYLYFLPLSKYCYDFPRSGDDDQLPNVSAHNEPWLDFARWDGHGLRKKSYGLWWEPKPDQGDCSKFKINIPHCFKSNPTMVDWLPGPGVPNNQQIANCCKGGAVSS
ncbi:hypothetical protein GH714_043290 [Hevea brasiliensis]|uniref:COBRA C-terminal domain-containing protein n=1 Tax=Hevea brasiliensis TaxID=3981 RepID=A0A6A6K2B5_HEVBR|nr:hypothetical protein GH714_043290 [Hevea brasiliensis]